MGKIADLAKQATNKASAEEQFDLLDYLGNLAPIQYLGNKIDDAAKYFGLEHGLSGTLARYAENLINNNKQPATSDVDGETMPKVNFMQNPDEQLNVPKLDATTAQYEAIRQGLIDGGMSFEEADKLAVEIMFSSGYDFVPASDNFNDLEYFKLTGR